ncbi:IS30 family transposase [Arthrobacter globiformis]|nr:IS30 family transposase [Arthrobacter globiformis]
MERTSRFVMLLHLPNGHTGEQVLAAIQETLPTLPAHLRRSLTWDQGAEMVGIHDQVKSPPGQRSTSATLTHPGSAARTRTL